MTTNNVPGSGAKDDSLSIDDIEFIYSAWLTNLSYNGATVEGFDKGTFFYGILVDDISQITADRIAATTEASDATAGTTIEYRGDTVALATIVVTAEDGTTTKTYTLKFATDPSQTVAIDNTGLNSSTPKIYPNPATTTITVEASGLLELTDLQGRTLLRRQCRQGEPIDISTLPKGIYIATIDGIKAHNLIVH